MFFLKRSLCHLMPSLRMNWIIWSSHFHLGLIYTRFHSKIIKNHPSFSSAPRVPWSQVANVPIPCAADSFGEHHAETSVPHLSIDFVESCGILPQYILGPKLSMRKSTKVIKVCQTAHIPPIKTTIVGRNFARLELSSHPVATQSCLEGRLSRAGATPVGDTNPWNTEDAKVPLAVKLRYWIWQWSTRI
jgi:hypothetical protein